jgi:hydrazine synthase alpha subunit-like protein
MRNEKRNIGLGLLVFIISFLLLYCGISSPKAMAAPNLLEQFRAGPMKDVEEIIFASRQLGHDGHWYANIGYYAKDEDEKAYREMGRLSKFNLRTKKLTVLLDDPKGTVRDPQVHYDGKKILFSYRKGGTKNFHLYEINTDGTGLKQLTDGIYDDIEPTYLPDGDIIFVSTRCKRWVNCWLTQVAILYRCDGQGKNIRPISCNGEHDNTPWPLPDGRILYQRWEYIDRSQVHYHHLWSCNPDGTGQMVYYGNLHPGILMIDAKPIPDSNKIVAIFSPGHGRKEHNGRITIVSPDMGPDDLGSARTVHQSANFRDPYAFSEDCIMIAHDTRISLMNGKGQTQEIYRLPENLIKRGVQCHEPRPLIVRKHERVMPPRVDLKKATGELVLTDIYEGRRMEGVKRGEIKKLLILEVLPMPIHYTGGMRPISQGGTFTLERVLGTIPIEEDGSAYMELPALRSLFFVALDKNNNSVKRMQSFLTVQPGEKTSCVGCHEQRTKTPIDIAKQTPLALKRSPRTITPLAGIPEVFDFPRDIQPILDKHCVKCHGYEETEAGGPYSGRVILTGDRGPIFSHSYYSLTLRRQVADGRNLAQSNYAPRTLGTSASPLMKKISGEHNNVKVSRHEEDMVRYWIESAAAFPGTYAALASGMIGDRYRNEPANTDYHWPSAKAASNAILQRCGGCHNKSRPIPVTLSGPGHRDLVWNLSRPEKSLMLLAPLSKKAGGFGICKNRTKNKGPKFAVPVFTNKNDKDYQTILKLAQDGKRHLEKIKRFDMPDFQPNEYYVREMKRYGVLPRDLSPQAKIDAYVTDQKYWESLWHKPGKM